MRHKHAQGHPRVHNWNITNLFSSAYLIYLHDFQVSCAAAASKVSSVRPKAHVAHLETRRHRSISVFAPPARTERHMGARTSTKGCRRAAAAAFPLHRVRSPPVNQTAASEPSTCIQSTTFHQHCLLVWSLNCSGPFNFQVYWFHWSPKVGSNFFQVIFFCSMNRSSDMWRFKRCLTLMLLRKMMRKTSVVTLL